MEPVKQHSKLILSSYLPLQVRKAVSSVDTILELRVVHKL